VLLVVMVFQIQPTANEAVIADTSTPGAVLELTFKDIDENEVPLSAYQGQLILVNYWATWCSPCKAELPMLDAYYQQHKNDGFLLLAVNVSDRPPEALEFVQEKGYSFPLLFDPPGNTLVDLKIRGLPASLLISPEGYLLKRWVGPLTQEILEEETKQYLQNGL